VEDMEVEEREEKQFLLKELLKPNKSNRFIKYLLSGNHYERFLYILFNSKHREKMLLGLLLSASHRGGTQHFKTTIWFK
jgi:hypothetical protein